MFLKSRISNRSKNVDPKCNWFCNRISHYRDHYCRSIFWQIDIHATYKTYKDFIILNRIFNFCSFSLNASLIFLVKFLHWISFSFASKGKITEIRCTSHVSSRKCKLTNKNGWQSVGGRAEPHWHATVFHGALISPHLPRRMQLRQMEFASLYILSAVPQCWIGCGKKFYFSFRLSRSTRRQTRWIII